MKSANLNRTTKEMIKKILGPVNTGRLEYLLKPHLRSVWNRPFNGQEFRRRMYDELLQKIQFEAIVETGTYRGATTELFSRSGLPVYTVEANPRYFGYIQMRFWREKNVRVYRGDSRGFLEQAIMSGTIPRKSVFFYLDAHWEADLPLREELELIFRSVSGAVVMVDDFEVPGTDYGFDDYGDGNTLNIEYLVRSEVQGLSAYFPSAGANLETGEKRGCVVLSNHGEIMTCLNSFKTLKKCQTSRA